MSYTQLHRQTLTNANYTMKHTKPENQKLRDAHNDTLNIYMLYNYVKQFTNSVYYIMFKILEELIVNIKI